MEMMSKDQVGEIVAEAANKALLDICSSAAPSVLFFLEKSGSIKSRTKIENLEIFAQGLESIFGFGAKIIEKRILVTLCTKLQVPEPGDLPDDFEFAETIERTIRLFTMKVVQETKRQRKETVIAQPSMPTSTQ